MTWPFPTKEQPLTPWTPKQEREYQRKQREQAPEAPFTYGLTNPHFCSILE